MKNIKTAWQNIMNNESREIYYIYFLRMVQVYSLYLVCSYTLLLYKNHLWDMNFWDFSMALNFVGMFGHSFGVIVVAQWCLWQIKKENYLGQVVGLLLATTHLPILGLFGLYSLLNKAFLDEHKFIYPPIFYSVINAIKTEPESKEKVED